MKIAIIEDEKLTAKDLAKTILSIDSDIEIVASLTSVEDALAFFMSKPQVDLIYSDIELGDGLSFEIFETLKLNTPIVFCTAYNHYALEAFKTIGIDYILKPFSKTAIENSLTKYHTLTGKTVKPEFDFTALIQSIKQKVSNQLPSVIVHVGDKIVPLKGNEIALFFIDNENTLAYTFEGKKQFVIQNMDTLEKTFAPDFFRANRQFLVNRSAVKDASHYFNRKIVINLNIPFQEQIVVGKLKVTAFTTWLAYN